MKHRIANIARIISCIAFLVLTIIGVSSLVRAMSLETITNENGIPASWHASSLGNPDTITVGIDYWDQRQDDCKAANRQFEWTMCSLTHAGATQGIVKNVLGADGYPVPSYVTAADSKAAHIPQLSNNITGHDPVQPTDNFYRWYHTVEGKSQYIKDQTLTFKKIGQNSYQYRGIDEYPDRGGFFPLDNMGISASDTATSKHNHNFHFTAHMRIGVRIENSGMEKFEFAGDDDVWVYLNNQLILDIGGLHSEIYGVFTIDQNGTISATVEGVDTNGDGQNPQTVTKTINTGLEAGDVVNLDFFYAERSTTAANNKITITGMTWPIIADSQLQSKILAKNGETDTNYVQYIATVKNIDTASPLSVTRFAAHLSDQSTYGYNNISGHEDTYQEYSGEGFIPLSIDTLEYTTTPNDPDSWQPIEISAPSSTEDGFTFKEPIVLAESGQAGDTVYFRYAAETNPGTGTINATASFYTEQSGVSGVAYSKNQTQYTTALETPSPRYNLNIKYISYEEQCSPAVSEDEGDDDAEDADSEPTEVCETVEKILDTDKKTLDAGTAYNIPTPTFDGYITEQTTVEGVLNDNADITVVYNKIPTEVPAEPIVKPVTYPITIEHVYEDGSTALETIYIQAMEGISFNIPAETIDGFTADPSMLSGTMGTSAMHFKVVYSKTEVPDVPVINPSEPEQPEEPEQPAEPAKPARPTTAPTITLPAITAPVTTPVTPDNTLDFDLSYTGPLGVVAFVPNTGVISSTIAPIFEQYFADVILSQSFVMGTLLIFAGSFAVYFSLRRYLAYEIAVNEKNTTSSKATKTAKAASAKKVTKNKVPRAPKTPGLAEKKVARSTKKR